MTELSREATQAARRWADHNSARINDAGQGPFFYADVTTVTAGGAADGTHALVKVTYRDRETDVNGYPDTYTPAVGHRVVCALVRNQLEIFHHSVGAP